jgi:hypothetical protein
VPRFPSCIRTPVTCLRCRQAGRRFFEQICASVKSCPHLPDRVVAWLDQAKILSRRCEKTPVCRLSRRTGGTNLGYNLGWRGHTHQLRAVSAPMEQLPSPVTGAVFPHASEGQYSRATQARGTDLAANELTYDSIVFSPPVDGAGVSRIGVWLSGPNRGRLSRRRLLEPSRRPCTR